MTVIATLSPGTQFRTSVGSHRVIAFLGRGGEGEAYRIEDARGESRVLKLYPPEASADFGTLRARVRWLTSLELWSASPVLAGAPRVAVEVAGRPGYVADFVPGDSLLEYGRRHPGNLAGALRAMTALAAGVHALERRGVSHSDISLANIRVHVDPNGVERTALIDLDGARTPGSTLPIAIVGTPGAIAPELFRADAVPTIETDRFALATAIHTAVFFRPPAAPHMSAGASIRTQAIVAARANWVEESDVSAGGMPIHTLCASLRRDLRRGLHDDPRVRPSAAHWYQSLFDAAGRVYACSSCGIEHVSGPEQERCAVCGAWPSLVLAAGAMRLDLHPPCAAIGRAQLRHGHVSHEHAMVRWAGFEPQVIDLDSRHGTELWNGRAWQRLPPRTPIELRVGDRLRFAAVIEARVE